jgi:hypothetical protein
MGLTYEVNLAGGEKTILAFYYYLTDKKHPKT